LGFSHGGAHAGHRPLAGSISELKKPAPMLRRCVTRDQQIMARLALAYEWLAKFAALSEMTQRNALRQKAETRPLRFMIQAETIISLMHFYLHRARFFLLT